MSKTRRTVGPKPSPTHGLDQKKLIDWMVGNQAADAAEVLEGNYFPDQHNEDFSDEERAASAEEVEPAQKNGVPMENRAAALDEKLLKDNPLEVNRLLIRGAVEAKSHFELMRTAMEAAKKGTINIAGPRSAFRPASQQNRDWDGKYGDTTAPELARGPNYEPSPAGQKKQENIIDNGKAGPYSSRHGQGTDFDIGSTNNSDFHPDDLAREKKKLSERKQAGESLTAAEQKTLDRTTPKYGKQFEWLSENAWKYGFFRPYHGDKFEDKANYPKENWHWSYYPVAQAFEELIKGHLEEFQKHLAGLFMAYEKKHEKNGRIPDMTSFVALKWVELHQNTNKKLVDE